MIEKIAFLIGNETPKTFEEMKLIIVKLYYKYSTLNLVQPLFDKTINDINNSAKKWELSLEI